MILLGPIVLALLVLAVVSALGARRLDAAHPPEGRFVAASGEAIHWVERGPATGFAVVLIHGASGNHRDLMVPLGEALAQRFRVIALDRPGHGHSSRNAGTALGAPDAQGRVLAAALRAAGVERALIVGHSYGAAVALGLALDDAALTAGLVLVAPVSHPWGAGGISWHNRVSALPIVGPVFSALFPYPIGALTIETVLPAVFRPDPVPARYLEEVAPDLVLRPSAFRANAEDVTALQASLTRLQGRYRSIRAPTLIVEGARDPIVRNDIHAAALLRSIPGAEFVSLPTGHMPHWSATAAVTAAIEMLAGRLSR